MACYERIPFPLTDFPQFPCNEEMEKIEIKKIRKKKKKKKIHTALRPRAC